MSWSEIKKAVNSNLNLPLNKKIEQVEEKVEYVGGVIPRGCIEKGVSKTGAYAGDAVNIAGAGCVIGFSAKSDYIGNKLTTAKITLYFDEGESNSKTIVAVSNSTSAISSGVSVDLNYLAGALSANTETIENSTKVINTPLYFKKTLRVKMETATDTNSKSSASVKYMLFN